MLSELKAQSHPSLPQAGAAVLKIDPLYPGREGTTADWEAS